MSPAAGSPEHGWSESAGTLAEIERRPCALRSGKAAALLPDSPGAQGAAAMRHRLGIDYRDGRRLKLCGCVAESGSARPTTVPDLFAEIGASRRADLEEVAWP